MQRERGREREREREGEEEMKRERDGERIWGGGRPAKPVAIMDALRWKMIMEKRADRMTDPFRQARGWRYHLFRGPGMKSRM